MIDSVRKLLDTPSYFLNDYPRYPLRIVEIKHWELQLV